MNLFPSFVRCDTAAGWRLRNPILAKGEFGFEQASEYTARIKAGNGKTRWNDLAYFKGFAPAAVGTPARELDGGGA